MTGGGTTEPTWQENVVTYDITVELYVAAAVMYTVIMDVLHVIMYH